jgi:glycosyltransferase involved in cell wall biosynthesis
MQRRLVATLRCQDYSLPEDVIQQEQLRQTSSQIVMSQELNAIPGLKPKRPLNILFVSHDAYPMGAQKLLLTLTSWLKQKELVNPRFVLAGPGALTDEFLRIGPILRWYTDRQKRSNADDTLRLLRSFGGKHLAAVYLNSAASGHVIEMTSRLEVPQIVHVHELEKSIERWVGAEKMASLRDHADLFVAASGPVADNLHERHAIERRKLRVVDAFIKTTGLRNISDSEKRECKTALGLDPDKKVVLGCGTTDWRKGPDLFVQVAQKIHENGGEPVQFLWVGGETEIGEMDKLRELAMKGGVGEWVKFVGEVAIPLPFMIASDVFLLPSREDPFPLVCLESADCGVPIICFAKAGGMADFVGSSCGKVAPYLDVPAMANALQSLLDDQLNAQSLGQRAREKVRSKFDVSVKGHDIYEILREVCETPHSPSVLSEVH